MPYRKLLGRRECLILDDAGTYISNEDRALGSLIFCTYTELNRLPVGIDRHNEKDAKAS